MRDGEHGAGLELASNGRLEQRVRLEVNRRRRLVQDEDARATENGAGQAEELAGADAEVLAS